MNEFDALERMMAPITAPGVGSANMFLQLARCLADISDRLSHDEVECLVQVGQRLYEAALGEQLADEETDR